MSANTTPATPSDSPLATPSSILPLHHPDQAALIVVPQAPLGTANQALGLGAKALLAKKMAKSNNPSYISPTDSLMTPCSQKLNAAKKKHFVKPVKAVSLFDPQTPIEKDDEGDQAPIAVPSSLQRQSHGPPMDDDENPF